MANYDLSSDPISSFQHWYRLAREREDAPDAFTLATLDSLTGFPSARIVLLKGIDEGRFVFYTNYGSPKCADIDKFPHVAAVFYWPKSMRQVRIIGRAIKCSLEKNQHYFNSRPFQSQVASRISKQSEPIEDRKKLVDNYHEGLRIYQNSEISIDNLWGGHFILPQSFEFFCYGEYRLNDRFLYEIGDPDWKIVRLQP